ncbi:hypothetical protein EJ110_NYTH15546 [Nymphaea thermarum]|nr:hypothetical protein EJ110_NYTH15546 [Nymphaea thermarum]
MAAASQLGLWATTFHSPATAAVPRGRAPHSTRTSFPLCPPSTKRPVLPPFHFHPHFRSHSYLVTRASRKAEEVKVSASDDGKTQPKEKKAAAEQQEEEEVVEEDLPWIEEKAADLVEFTGLVTQAIPGPRVGKSSLPWLLALPLAYVSISLVIAVVKTVKKFTSPKAQKRKLVNKNAMLCRYIDEYLEKGRDTLQHSALQDLMKKDIRIVPIGALLFSLCNQTGFSMEEVLRKYLRYALNEKPFNPEVILDLIHLRKVSMLEDAQVAEVLNEISRRIVREKGPVVMDISGFTEKGFKRKLAVQALFGKILYLSELQEFCSRDSSLTVKEIFGVTDDDADNLRIHTFSEAGDMGSLEKMVDNSDPEPASESSSLDADS